MKNAYYKLIVMFFYYIGDVACKFNFEKAFDVYQKSMKLSFLYDEKLGHWFWKKPLNTDTDL